MGCRFCIGEKPLLTDIGFCEKVTYCSGGNYGILYTLDFRERWTPWGTNCFKYDFAREMGMPEDVLPLWVADMDFPTAPAVLERLHALAEHGIFGYTGVKDAYFSAVHNWYAQRFGWETQRSWLVTTPGVVFAIAIAIRAFTQKGDAILIQQPVYYPFTNKVTENDRQLVVNPLVLKNGRYEMDFADMERKIVDYHVKMLLLCSPHNPVGR